MVDSIRSAEDVAKRVLGLLAVSVRPHKPEEIMNWYRESRIERYLSRAELEFMNNAAPDEHSLIQFSWRAEAMVSLLWSLRGFQEMPPLTAPCNIFQSDLTHHAIQSPQAFIASASLREKEEIASMEAYLYHQHWRVRDRDLGFNNDEPGPSDPPIDELMTGLVQERRYGMSWIAGYGDDWDHVPLDT